MKHLLLLLFMISLAFCYTLTLPYSAEYRYGAEGIALGETGAAYSNELSAIFYNPANAPFYGMKNKINIAFAGFYENQLPELEDYGIWSTGGGIGVFLPYVISNITISFVQTYNLYRIDEEKYIVNGEWDGFYKSLGESDWTLNSTISAAWKEIVSLGLSFKPFYISYDKGDAGTGLLLDVGIRGQYYFELSPSFYLMPGVGFSARNIGKDSVSYVDDYYKEKFGESYFFTYPVGKTISGGASIEFGNEHVLWGALLVDYTHELVRDSDNKLNPARINAGFQLGVTPLIKLNTGYLKYLEEGFWEEVHWGVSLGYNHSKFKHFMKKSTPVQNSK